MSRLKTIKRNKSEQRTRNSKSTKSTSTLSNSSSSSVPLIGANPPADCSFRDRFEKRNLNKNYHLNSIEQTTQLAWRPIINEILSSKRSFRSIKCKRFKNRFPRPPKDVKPRNLFKSKAYFENGNSFDNQIDQNSFLDNNYGLQDKNRIYDTHHPKHSRSPINSQLRKYLKRRSLTSSSENDQQINFSSTFSSNEESLTDRNVPNDILYSLNAIYDFEVPNFETNRFEKIKSNVVDLDRCDLVKHDLKDSKLDCNHNQYKNHHRNFLNGYSSEDSNEQIYGVCSSTTYSSKLSTKSSSFKRDSIPEQEFDHLDQFIDLSSELDTSLNTENNQYIRDKLIDNLFQSRKQIIRDDKLNSNQTNLKDEESIYDTNKRPQMIISKSIQLNSELDSDLAEFKVQKSINHNKFKDRSNRTHLSQLNQLNNAANNPTINASVLSKTKVDNELINDQLKDRLNRATRSTIEPYEIACEKKHSDKINLNQKLSSINAISYQNEFNREQQIYLNNPTSRHSISHELDHCKENSYNFNNYNQHNQSELISDRFRQANHPNQIQLKQQQNKINYPQNIKQLNRPNNIKKQEDNQHQSITMPPILAANHLELPPQHHPALAIDHANKPTHMTQHTNFFLQHHYPFNLQQSQPLNANLHPDSAFQPNLAFYKQTEAQTQRHFLVTFKHYYPETSSKWSFIVLTCVCLIHSLQFVFQIENLFIIDSSVYFNSSLTLSVFTGALSSCLSYLLAPFVISFCQYNSSRLIAFLGSIVSALGLLFTSFATLPGQLLIAFSIFYSIGSSLLRESSSTILSKYFKRRRVLVEMIIVFFCYLSYAFLPIILSYVINTKIWRNGFQMYATLFLICFFVSVFLRPASLYHPQRKAILHLKSLQKRSKLKRKQQQQQTKSESDHVFSLIRLIGNKIRNVLKSVDYSPLQNSRTIQLLLCSVCLISFGIFNPIFVLCPTLYIQFNFQIATLYYLQLTFGLSGCISPILAYSLFKRPSNRKFNDNEKLLDGNKMEDNFKSNDQHIQQEKTKNSNKLNYRKSKYQDPLFLIKLSSLAIALLQFYLIQLDFSQQLTINLISTFGLYAFFFSMLFCSLKIFIIRKVRARSICVLWSWFSLVQSLPLLIGCSISAFLNDTFGNNIGSYFAAISCLAGFLSLFSIDIHRALNRKHIDSYLNKTQQNSKFWPIKRCAKDDSEKAIKKPRQPNETTDAKLTRSKDDTATCFSNAKPLNQSVRLLSNNKKKVVYSNANDDIMKFKFLNCRQEQHPNKYQRIDQNLIQRNNSFPQLSVNGNQLEWKVEDNFLPFVFNPNLFTESETTYPVANNNYIFGSRHSLDTLLNKFTNQSNAPLINFSSLPEITNILTSLRAADLEKLNFNKFNKLPLLNFNSNKALINPVNNKYTNSSSKEKIIYLSKNDSSSNDKRRNSQLTKISQIDEIDYVDGDDKIKFKSKKESLNSSSESLTDPDSDPDLEIDVDCNQIKNDKQVLEDLNELINESLNNDNLNNLDKLFVKCTPSCSLDNDADVKGQCSKAFKNQDTLEGLKGLRKNSQTSVKRRLNDENTFSGQLMCEDYEDLVESLLLSKNKEKHLDNCVMSRLIQEILKQITIKSLTEEFNQTSPSNSPITNSNLIHFNHLNQINENNLNPSIRLKENLLASKCVNCDKLLTE